jgi:SSS family solute:Na+ symporter
MKVSLDLIVLATYLIGILVVGLWAKRKATTQEDFLVAGRSVGPVLYSGTLAAVILGGGATVGGVKLGYLYGLSGMWLVFMYGLGMIVVGVVLVPRILKLNLFTITELLERRYSIPSRVAGGLVMAAYDLMIVVTGTIAAGAVMEVIVGMPRTPSILLASAVTVTYSVFGGMWSLTNTDIVQFVIKTIGMLFILLPASILYAGGWSGMHAHLPPEFFSWTHIGIGKILTFFTLYFLGMLIGQDGWQRVFTARSVKVARDGGLYVGLYCIVYAIAGATIGAAGRVFLPALENPDLAFGTIVNIVLPDGMRGLLLAASLSAIMSTASACLLASSTVLLEDVYLPLRKTGGGGSITQVRVITMSLGALATTIACLTNDVIAALSVAYDLLVGALFVPVLGAILWRRSSRTGALASIVIGGLAVVGLLGWYGVDSDAPIYGGLGLSLLVYMGFTLLAPDAPRPAAMATDHG